MRYIKEIKKLQQLAEGSKLRRFFHNPFKYLLAIGFSKFIYPLTHKKIERQAKLFFGKTMKLLLPASTDIYLTCGKSDDAEIRLAQFIIRHLKKNDHFLDVGAHYGYFSLLASAIAGPNGKVIACEPSAESFGILNQNAANELTALQFAIADTNEAIEFYEFPNRYSEYNTIYPEQFEQSNWIKKYAPVKTTVPATTIDQLTSEYNLHPVIIKIDTEGAEYSVIKGALAYLKNHSCFVAMEYLAKKRGNSNHKKAATLLASIRYYPNKIEPGGSPSPISNIDAWLQESKRDSDNIVFAKV